MIDHYPVDQRAVAHYWAFSTIKYGGAGQFYLLSIRDKQGIALDGGNMYRLHDPAKVPATLY